MTASQPSRQTNAGLEVLIIGAGMAGLAAARELVQSGRRVLVVDKGRGVGGRMATRRIGDATFDHGAQFITVRDTRFERGMERWVETGVAAEWFRPEGSSPGHPRFRGVRGMTAIPKKLAEGVDVRLGCRVTSISEQDGQWSVALEDGTVLFAQSVIVTAPVPQSITLLDAGGVSISTAVRDDLNRVTYEPCIAVMAILDGPSNVPEPGGIVPRGGPVAWIADNAMKGVSAVPALTIHGNGPFSESVWDIDREDAGLQLLDAAASFVGGNVTKLQVHGWRYSKPVQTVDTRCVELMKSPTLVISGDAFGGPRVEGAALSGWAAAEHIMKTTGSSER